MSNTDGLAQCCQNFFVKMREKREGERSEPSELFRFLRTDVQERLEEGERSEPSELLRFAKFATFCNDCQLLMKKRDLGLNFERAFPALKKNSLALYDGGVRNPRQ